MLDLQSRNTPGAAVSETAPGGWRLLTPPGEPGGFRLAQLDDYLHKARAKFKWQPPLKFNVTARVSTSSHAGTWGFGFWNDPFNLSLGIAGTSRRLPALPNAAWFFYASPSNYLSFRDDQPAHGMLAAAFSSLPIPSLLLAPAAIALPLMFFRFTTPLLRRLLRLLIREEAFSPFADWTEWHNFSFVWYPDHLDFNLDGESIFQTTVSPRGKLGLVIWIDNQFARLTPGERFHSGTLGSAQPGWLDIQQLSIENLR